MKSKDLQESWKEQGEATFAAVAQWRETHPKATLAQIEEVIDRQINHLRAQMIQEAAQVSEAATSEAVTGLTCEQCGKALQARGRGRRRWQTQGGKPSRNRTDVCDLPPMWGRVFSP